VKKREKTVKILKIVKKKKNCHFRARQLLPSKQSLITQFMHLQTVLKSCNSPIVFCHNDLNMVNIIHTVDTESVTFIDFEYAQPNFQAFDIANHFAKIAGSCDDAGIDYGLFPSRDFQMRWLKHYLREFHGRRDVKSYEIEQLQGVVSKFVVSSHFLWTCWCLIQAEHSTIEFDFVK
jgi:ethanolamine kinase